MTTPPFLLRKWGRLDNFDRLKLRQKVSKTVCAMPVGGVDSGYVLLSYCPFAGSHSLKSMEPITMAAPIMAGRLMLSRRTATERITARTGSR